MPRQPSGFDGWITLKPNPRTATLLPGAGRMLGDMALNFLSGANESITSVARIADLTLS